MVAEAGGLKASLREKARALKTEAREEFLTMELTVGLRTSFR